MRANSRIVRRPVPPVPEELAVGLHPVLARVYRARSIVSSAELDHSLARLLPFETLKGIEAAGELLADAVRSRRSILVVGDFDADGATGCAVAVRGLRALGATQVEYLVPNRFEFGYGLTPEIVRVAAERRPDVLVTVDNGISSIEGVHAANALGIQVLVTDHHLPGAELPAASAVVNPNQPGDHFPSKVLAGVGVMFYVLVALRALLREAGWFDGSRGAGPREPNLARLLDLVALGTVADVVPLDHNNRILVAQGLARINRGQGHPGVRALLSVAGRNWRKAVASDLAFAVAPRLNAAGRLDDMSLGIECLLADDEATAARYAAQLDELNRARREIEADMHRQADAHLEKIELDTDAELPFGLSLFDPSWHQGVVGILASRLKDRLHRPVIVFAPDGEHAVKGSARSVSGLHLRDALAHIAAEQPGLMTRFGGHAMAAGLTLARERLAEFAGRFDAEVRRHLDADDLHGTLHSDGDLAGEDLGLEMAHLLRAGGPWGQGFPEPLFDGEFDVERWRIVGERHLRLGLRVPGSGQAIGAIAFGAATDDWPTAPRRLRLGYRLDVNDYRGVESAQLVVESLEVID